MLLEIGQFARISKGDLYWKRELGLDEMGRMTGVKATIDLNQDGTGNLRLYIEPSITSYEQHAERRIQASTAMEIATRYAEKVAGEINQYANITGCITEGGIRTHKLAHYPMIPLAYENLCTGFKEVYGLAI